MRKLATLDLNIRSSKFGNAGFKFQISDLKLGKLLKIDNVGFNYHISSNWKNDRKSATLDLVITSPQIGKIAENWQRWIEISHPKLKKIDNVGLKYHIPN